MILLDTHIWVWWVSKRERLQLRHRDLLEGSENGRLEVSIISCWEVAKLVECGRLKLDRPVETWIEEALTQRAVELVPLSPRIVVESTQLPEPFHRDPADQLLVATARVLGCQFMTEDSKIASYPHVQIV